MAGLGEHFLIKSFTDYYQELAAARWAISQGMLVEYLELPISEKAPVKELLVSLLFKKLRSTLSAQQQDIRAQATLNEQKDYLRVLYVLAALTDEQLLLDTDWDMAELWEKELMETTFFGTAQAGTRFYEHLDEVLNDRSNISNRSDLAATFLFALSLGFRGRYRSNKGEQQIQRLRTRLYRKLNTGPKTGYLFSQAYQHGLREIEDSAKHRISPLSKWYRFGGLAFGLYLFVSSMVWIATNQSLTNTLNVLECGEGCETGSTAQRPSTNPSSSGGQTLSAQNQGANGSDG